MVTVKILCRNIKHVEDIEMLSIGKHKHMKIGNSQLFQTGEAEENIVEERYQNVILLVV